MYSWQKTIEEKSFPNILMRNTLYLLVLYPYVRYTKALKTIICVTVCAACSQPRAHGAAACRHTVRQWWRFAGPGAQDSKA